MTNWPLGPPNRILPTSNNGTCPETIGSLDCLVRPIHGRRCIWRAASDLASVRRREEQFWWASFVSFEVGVFYREEGVFVGGGRKVVHRVSELGFHTTEDISDERLLLVLGGSARGGAARSRGWGIV